ncbi:MAG: response regulator transcription factor [Armatimonadota bacterium]
MAPAIPLSRTVKGLQRRVPLPIIGLTRTTTAMLFHRTFLLLDDHSGSREELRGIIRHAGATILGTAGTTDEALERVAQLRPDAVVIDVNLPGTYDPIVTIQRMRRLVPELTVFCTGSASQSAVMMEALSMGASDFFLKPLQQRTVSDCLQRNLG